MFNFRCDLHFSLYFCSLPEKRALSITAFYQFIDHCLVLGIQAFTLCTHKSCYSHRINQQLVTRGEPRWHGSIFRRLFLQWKTLQRQLKPEGACFQSSLKRETEECFCIFLQHCNTAHPFTGSAFPPAATVPWLQAPRITCGQFFYARNMQMFLWLVALKFEEATNKEPASTTTYWWKQGILRYWFVLYYVNLYLLILQL